jgi:TonB family protein
MLCIVILAALPCLAADKSAHAGTDTLEQDLHTKYEHQVLMLRDFYCGKELKFASDGRLISGGYSGSWTTCRDIRIEKVKISNGKLSLSGHRIYLWFDPQMKQFRDVTLDQSNKEKRAEARKYLKENSKLSLQIGLPPNADESAIQSILGKLFYGSEQEFQASVSGIWVGYFHPPAKSTELNENQLPANKKVPQVGNDQLLNGQAIERVGSNGVRAPQVIYNPDPDYSDEARAARFQGTVVLTAVVGPKGNVDKLWVLRPLGLGLDEQAAAKIATWKFKPASKDGNPVAVEVQVEVSFNLY